MKLATQRWTLADCWAWWPVLILLVWRTEAGRLWAMGVLFAACATKVACEFRDQVPRTSEDGEPVPRLTWRRAWRTLAGQVLLAWALFAAVSLSVSDSRDHDVVVLALILAITSLCVTPYLMQLTQKVFASVVFTFLAALLTKLLGCVVVVLVYGWDACERGYTTMPFTHPNLLVWMIWLNTTVLCAWCYSRMQRRLPVPSTATANA
jgi:hypothetical protein